MNKSVYSLVLSDDVVLAVDRAAAKRGVSRSSLINEILASHLSCVTPEMRMRDIFRYLEQVAENERFRMQTQPSDAMFNLFSSVSYKYNPTVRYSVSLSRSADPVLGVLKVSFRTQSRGFTDALAEFFYLFCALEESNAPEGIKYQTEPGRFSRLLVVPRNTSYSAKEAGLAIADYIQMFDKGLNTYFATLPDKDTAALRVARIYKNYLEQKPFKI